MLHTDYDSKGSVATNKKEQDSGRKPQEAWRLDELIGGKQRVVK
jgi:hypothetical protein